MVNNRRFTNYPVGQWRMVVSPVLLGLATLMGCGTGLSVPATVPVCGVVRYKGKPLQGVRVTLHAQGERAKCEFVPTGETGPDGKFTLSTGAPGNGAPPGRYVVTFEKPEIGSSASTGSVETEIDAFRGKFNDPSQSKWTVTIERGENSLQPFELN